MKLRLLYHGHCFDGVASAATFTRFYHERIHPEAEVNYTGLLHRPGNLFDLTMFDSDENAIVDFKYAASEKLTWWFDHHESAFLTPEDEAHFRADKSGRKFLDPTRKSCTEFIADVARERFGFNDEPIKSLVHWAHIDPLTAYLATSPGGADSVAIIAASSPVDVPFVLTMQVLRMLFVMATGPAIARMLARQIQNARQREELSAEQTHK